MFNLPCHTLSQTFWVSELYSANKFHFDSAVVVIQFPTIGYLCTVLSFLSQTVFSPVIRLTRIPASETMPANIALLHLRAYRVPFWPKVCFMLCIKFQQHHHQQIFKQLKYLMQDAKTRKQKQPQMPNIKEHILWNGKLCDHYIRAYLWYLLT